MESRKNLNSSRVLTNPHEDEIISGGVSRVYKSYRQYTNPTSPRNLGPTKLEIIREDNVNKSLVSLYQSEQGSRRGTSLVDGNGGGSNAKIASRPFGKKNIDSTLAGKFERI
jgi:hypothetical protein